MKSVMSHSFSQVPGVYIPRSTFDRSHGNKCTIDAGYVLPIYVDEVLPGDTFNMRMAAFARLATPKFPIMDNIFMETFFFFCPYRLVWNNFQKFMGEQTDPGDSTDYLVPTMTSPITTGYTAGSLYDYMGIPTEVPLMEHSSLHMRAYNLIWNEWFRDQNMQDSVVVDKDDGPDDPADYVPLRRGKRHDYFTSALPFAQKGPSVALPLGDSAPVYGREIEGSFDTFNMWQGWQTTGTPGLKSFGLYKPNTQLWMGPSSGGTLDAQTVNGISLGTPEQYAAQAGSEPPYALLSEATGATINALRQAMQIQVMYERDARGGTRYTEIVRSHFGVISPDARLQRPEYLGGGSSHVNIHPIAQTSATDGGTPQGNLAAIGTSTVTGHGFTKSFTEHGCLIGLINIRADLNYQQGLNKMWSRRTRFDFYWPSFAHLGEQAVLNKEIYAQGDGFVNPSTGELYDEEAFGYQERYAEYRYKPSTVCGQFRSNYATSLDSWHLAQEFESLPALNEEFIVDQPPMDRILAVPSGPDFLVDMYFNLRCARPMPLYGVPGWGTRF